ncbi:MAG: hypothetical protein VZQ83_07370 [Eubacterium sp.]|nr:hypothetical protein [Eubacterium sp.]
MGAAKEGVIVMVAAYNLYLGGYLPRLDPQRSVHNRQELKTKYKNIVSMNNSNPQTVVRISNKTQAYVLNVKELSMELGEATESVLRGDQERLSENMAKMAETFNDLLKKSDEFGKANGKPSRPGGELRNMIRRHTDELTRAGFSIDDEGFLTAPVAEDSDSLFPPVGFVSELEEKAEEMSMNPMEYVEQKVYSYGHLAGNDIGPAYENSLYSGMLFNSYC